MRHKEIRKIYKTGDKKREIRFLSPVFCPGSGAGNFHYGYNTIILYLFDISQRAGNGIMIKIRTAMDVPFNYLSFILI